VRLLSFGPEAGHPIDRFGSEFVLAPLTNPGDGVSAVCIHLRPGGLVGEHEAAADQLFCVVRGEGWVSGGDGIRHPITYPQAAYWTAGERHAAGSDDGLTAVVLEGPSFTPRALRLDTS
jgi:hypothetical protein